MFPDIIRFEWRYHTRQLSFAAGAAIFAVLGFILTVGLGRQDVHANSPYLIIEVAALLSLMSIFPLTVFSANAILRDRDYGMEEIVFSTAIGKEAFLLGRFSGALLASLTLMLFAMAGMFAAPLSGLIHPDRVGPVIPIHYLQAFVFVVLPDVLFAAVVVFAIAALTRSAPASYVGSVVLYALYFVAAALTNSPLMAASTSNAGVSMRFASLVDPFGLTAFFEQTRYWTILERDMQMVALTGNFLANRILWTLVALLILAFVFRSYPFRLIVDSRRRDAKRDDEDSAATRPYRTFDSEPDAFSQFASATRLEIRLLMRTFPFLVLLLTWVVFAVPEVWGAVTSGEYGAAFLPTTSLVISRLRQPLAVFGTLAMIYWSAEAFWRERSVGIDPIVSATPVAGPALFGSKVAALAVMSAVLAVTGAAVGVVIQIMRGGAPIEPDVYLGFGLLGVMPLLILAAGCGVIQVLSPGKYPGLLFSFVLAAYMHRGGVIGVEHHLLRFATAPPVGHSDMGGFGDPVIAYAWFTLYWALVVSAFALAAGHLWRRHDDERFGARLRSLARTTSKGERLAMASPAAAAALVGAFIFANTNIVNRYESTAQMLDWKAAYERTYGSHAGDVQPRIVAIETDIDIDPDARRLRLEGEYIMTNPSTQPISRLLVTVRRDAKRATLAVNGRPPDAIDARFGMYTFELERPLLPGESVTLTFEVAYAARGFTNDGPDNPVEGNGSFVMGFLRFPGVGYRSSYEIRDPDERAKRGLPARRSGTQLTGESGDDDVPRDEWVSVDTTISTTAGQIAVAPGRLIDTRHENGRSTFHYRTDHPIPNVLAFVSARYEVTRARHAGVDIEIYRHADHGRNVPAILETARASLDVFQEAFGPYPHRELRIAEVPSSANFGGFATPGLVLLAENRVFLVDDAREQPIDLVCRRVAHEIAHQWWGHHLVPAPVDGGTFLTESVTKYAETLVLERLHGLEQVRNLRAIELDRYLSGRVGEVEPPLSEVAGQSFLFYSKGLLVMGALGDLLGAEALESALRSLMAAESGPAGNATTLDLLEHLDAVAPPSDRALIDDWMKRVVLYDLAVAAARSTRLPDGRYEITVEVRASKVRIDEEGREQPMAMDEAIGVLLVAGESGGSPRRVEKVRLRSGLNVLKFVVENEPEAVEIDPELLRIDRNRLDNVWRIETGS